MAAAGKKYSAFVVSEFADQPWQIYTFLRLKLLWTSCLSRKFGETENLLDVLMKYAIFENFRYVLDQETI